MSKVPLLQLSYYPDAGVGGGRIQILSHGLGMATGPGSRPAEDRSHIVQQIERTNLVQLMFFTDGQLHAWLADLQARSSPPHIYPWPFLLTCTPGFSSSPLPLTSSV